MDLAAIRNGFRYNPALMDTTLREAAKGTELALTSLQKLTETAPADRAELQKLAQAYVDQGYEKVFDIGSNEQIFKTIGRDKASFADQGQGALPGNGGVLAALQYQKAQQAGGAEAKAAASEALVYHASMTQLLDWFQTQVTSAVEAQRQADEALTKLQNHKGDPKQELQLQQAHDVAQRRAQNAFDEARGCVNVMNDAMESYDVDGDWLFQFEFSTPSSNGWRGDAAKTAARGLATMQSELASVRERVETLQSEAQAALQ